MSTFVVFWHWANSDHELDKFVTFWISSIWYRRKRVFVILIMLKFLLSFVTYLPCNQSSDHLVKFTSLLGIILTSIMELFEREFVTHLCYIKSLGYIPILHVSDCEIFFFILWLLKSSCFSGSYSECKLWLNHYKHWCQSLYTLPFIFVILVWFDLCLIRFWFVRCVFLIKNVASTKSVGRKKISLCG